ncbi:MAG TPA: LOG family protein [Candidatus Brocadiia bacterium]|nr:LOG family protein [Candidatus Brocadiia bacterium]
MRPKVTLFGSSQARPGSAAYEAALEAGRLVGRAGFDLVNGGLGGVMEASARGAREAGARVIGVTLGSFGKRANAFVDEERRAGDFWERTRVMLDLGDAVLVLPGGTGTLAEAAVAWEMLHKRQCEIKPLALVGEFWRPLVTMMCPGPQAPAWCGGALRLAADAAEAVRFFDEFFARPALA